MIERPKYSNNFIADGAKVLGDVSLGEESSIWFNATVRADHQKIIIGSNTNIQDNSVLHMDPGDDILIGNNVTIGHGAIVHGCSIGNNTIIGMGAIILNHAKIGNNCVVGAGALVTQGVEIPDGSLVLGSPAKVKRELTDEEKESILANANHYSELAREYMNS